MKNHLTNSKKNHLKGKKLIIGELSNKQTFLLTPPWLERQEEDEELAEDLVRYVAEKLKGVINGSSKNTTGR